MLVLKSTLKLVMSGLLFGASVVAAGLAMAVAGLWLIGLVDWTGTDELAGIRPASGASEDSRAEFPLPPGGAPTD